MPVEFGGVNILSSLAPLRIQPSNQTVLCEGHRSFTCRWDGRKIKSQLVLAFTRWRHQPSPPWKTKTPFTETQLTRCFLNRPFSKSCIFRGFCFLTGTGLCFLTLFYFAFRRAFASAWGWEKKRKEDQINSMNYRTKKISWKSAVQYIGFFLAKTNSRVLYSFLSFLFLLTLHNNKSLIKPAVLVFDIFD